MWEVALLEGDDAGDDEFASTTEFASLLCLLQQSLSNTSTVKIYPWISSDQVRNYQTTRLSSSIGNKLGWDDMGKTLDSTYAVATAVVVVVVVVGGPETSVT